MDKILKTPFEEKEFRYTKLYWKHKPIKPNAPIAIEPRFTNDRIRSQRGIFTVNDDSNDPIDIRFPDSIKKVILPVEAKASARLFLSESNIDDYTMSPDLIGLLKFFQKKFNLN